MKEARTRTDSTVGVRGWITPALLNATSAPWTKEMRRVGGRDLIVNMDDGGEKREEKKRKEKMKRCREWAAVKPPAPTSLGLCSLSLSGNCLGRSFLTYLSII